jgi:ABC-type dipeptide/oligopeptide/nickel transport system permease component
MGAFIGRRLLHSVPVLLLASLVVFSMLQLVPGDPIDAMLGASAFQTGSARQDLVDHVRQELGLNDPLPVQYGHWILGALHGDFGVSFVRGRPVIDLILERLPSTAQLALASLVFAVVFGLVLGIVAATHGNTPIDAGVMLLSLGGVSLPSFALGVLLILVFSVGLSWLPATGAGSPEQLVLPTIALGYEGVAQIARLTRTAMLDALSAQFITTARAKGLTGGAIVLRHALRNALIPIVTVAGLQAGHLLAGSVVVETVFARQGIGQLAIEAILTKDYPLVQGIILLSATTYILINLLTDLAYGYLDPRIRAGD